MLDAVFTRAVELADTPPGSPSPAEL